MTTFFTSDIHLFHRNILKFEPEARPFETLEEMHTEIIKRWNSKVSKGDEVYILGDVSFGKDFETVEILDQLNGEFCLVIGNHDEKILRSNSFKKKFSGGFADIIDTKINGKHYVMCHYPLMTWNRSHHGSINLFGHLHSKWKGNSQQLNVGMDCHNLTPICIDDIDDILKELPERTIELHA